MCRLHVVSFFTSFLVVILILSGAEARDQFEKYWREFDKFCIENAYEEVNRIVKGVSEVEGVYLPGTSTSYFDEGCSILCRDVLLTYGYGAYQNDPDESRYQVSDDGFLTARRFGGKWYPLASKIPDWEAKLFKSSGLESWGPHEYWLTYWGHPNCKRRLLEVERQSFLRKHGERVRQFVDNTPIICVASRRIAEITAKYKIFSRSFADGTSDGEFRVITDHRILNVVDNQNGGLIASHRSFLRRIDGPGTKSSYGSKPHRLCKNVPLIMHYNGILVPGDFKHSSRFPVE